MEAPFASARLLSVAKATGDLSFACVQQAGPSLLGSRPAAPPKLVALSGSPSPLAEPPLSGPFFLLVLVAPHCSVSTPPSLPQASGMALNPAFPAFRNQDCFEILSASPPPPLTPLLTHSSLSSNLTFRWAALEVIHLSVCACTWIQTVLLCMRWLCVCPGVGVSVSDFCVTG